MSETNKRQQAIALKYQSDVQDAPKVIAKGKGLTAENIIEVAKEKNIPIQEDHNLVELLGQLELNETIPEELYEAVAEVFAFIYRLDRNIAN
ncbi:EscU/YscU/HrcU family type III secretion system export apparatus switch protein [Heyndrickxia vini]|uniref:EscU/YscU/HrcU family type III secretion system export apparatus switch protein n=1 Tax=Heyndrickxia vini TaxID=1476025 RepID=A0ABX7DY30_9BACI|nr:EscU/YscU/HrcU family type III secretion system export apparatus switch protein [Heyndrickxia vini]QQZ07960.1 EscU/YscU/HrcU family type III secretion system export apparatus switch protein [Heyndrickxia vini]